MIGLGSIAWISAFAFIVSLVLTPLIRDAFARRGLVDRPDGGRKFHDRPVPRVGGIPIAVSYAAAFGLLLAMPAAGSAFGRHLPAVLSLLPSAGLVFLAGLVDDLRGLRPWQKLAAQTAGAGMAVAAGVRITGLSGHPLDPNLGAVLTVLWLLACSNAFNLIDGLDGLASGMGFFSTLTIFLAALLHGDHPLALATLPLAGSLLGFLRYNFNPASVFLGDSGSLLIGFLLGCYGVIWSQKSATMLGMTAPLMAMAIPLIDVLLSIFRRWLRGKPIFAGDRNHIHHKLLERGLTHRRVVAVLYGAGGLYALLSLLQSHSERQVGGLILVLFCSVTWIGIRHLDYFEFGMAAKTLFGGGLRRLMSNQLVLHGLDQSLHAAPDEFSCWEILRQTLGDAGFAGLYARFNGREFRQPRTIEGPCWQLRIPLPRGDYFNLERSFDSPVQTVMIGPLAECLHRRLSSRLADIAASSGALSLARLAACVDSFEPAQAPQAAPSAREPHPVSRG
jgi:UDP-GlcNAc:undecaprenyl-phosphate GlcNAc-1-phosphate transferase